MGYTAAIVTVSDKLFAGNGENVQEASFRMLMEERGWNIVETKTISGDNDIVRNTLIELSDQDIPLVLTIGGGGYSDRSFVPEVTLGVIEREVRGIPELMRQKSMELTPAGCLSRGVAGIRRKTLIVNLPGNIKAAIENFNFGEDAMKHVVRMLWPEDTPKP